MYGTREVGRLLGIPVSAVRSLIRAGHVSPGKDRRGRLQFSFQDLIIVRTAKALSGANLSPRRINRCLRQVRAALPADLPLSGLSITAVGDQVAVREGRQHWDTESGQYLLALEVVSVNGGEIRIIAREAPPAISASPNTEDDGLAHYERAYSLEDEDAAAAIAAYQQCLAVNKAHADARLNCGRLLHMEGRLADAERVYREAETIDAALLFNMGVLLEDMGREADAIQAYRDALELDADLADAHFNLARLYERRGNQRDSFRHLLAYKRASESG
jgi:tetratricopeptide (TPR) repeat protein